MVLIYKFYFFKRETANLKSSYDSIFFKVVKIERLKKKFLLYRFN